MGGTEKSDVGGERSSSLPDAKEIRADMDCSTVSGLDIGIY